jgi:hypothetical protein
MRLFGMLIVLGALTPAAAAAQNDVAIKPGSELLKATNIRERQDTFTIVNYRDGKMFRESRLVRTVKRVREGNQNLIRQAQVYDTPNGVTVDTSWIDALTLAPVRYYADILSEKQEFRYKGSSFEGTVTPRDSAPRTVSETKPEPFFDMVSFDLLYAAIPLAAGSTASISGYNPPRMFLNLKVSPAGEDRIPRKDGTLADVLKIRYEVNGRGIDAWLDPKTHEFVRMGSAQGGNAFWKVRSDFAVPAPGAIQ